FDIGLVTERVDGVAHLLARLLYLEPDPVWVFAHWMSSFTVSTVWGAGGVAERSAVRPACASTAVTTPQRTVVISAASQSGRAASRAMTISAVSAPSI